MNIYKENRRRNAGNINGFTAYFTEDQRWKGSEIRLETTEG